MQKINIISCCAECSACKVSPNNNVPLCEKQSRRIDENYEGHVNPALVGFPEWCPLETVETPRGIRTNYKKEIKNIMQIMGDESNQDALQEASHYLNTVVENAKKEVETNQP